MAPKKKGAKDKDDTPQVASLYVKREPLPPLELPDVTEAEVAWKAGRNHFVLPLAPWESMEDVAAKEAGQPPPDADAAGAWRLEPVPKSVDTCEWKPNELETLFVSDSFSAKSLPKSIMKDVVVGWRRAPIATDNSSVEEQEPQAQPLPEVEEPPPEVDPKAKAKAKAEPKAKGKGAVPDPGAARTTAEQFADIELNPTDGTVVTPAEFATRELLLSCDEAAPPLTQTIAAQFAIIGELRHFIPRGSYLWELIYPQYENGMPRFNPHGKYIVRLFVQGKWRQVLVDDVIPVGFAASGAGATYAPVFPSASAPGVIWPQILSKALMKAYQAELSAATLPVVMALTGWVPYQLTLTWPSLYASLSTRLFVAFQAGSEIGKEEAAPSVPSKDDNKPGRKGKASIPDLPALNFQKAEPQMMPKLGGLPGEALLQFIVCEMVEGPQQVRMKASTWRPTGGMARRVILKEYESEGEEEEDEEDDHQGGRREEELTNAPSEVDVDDDEDEDVDRRSQRSPSATGTGMAGATPGDGGGSGAAASARSKEEGGGGSSATGDAGGDEAKKEVAAESGDPAAAAAEDATDLPAEYPWPVEQAKMRYQKSQTTEHRTDLLGGFWVPFEQLQEAHGSYFVYLPPNDKLLCQYLDTTWPRERKTAYTPASLYLLKLKLTPEEDQEEYHDYESGATKELSPPSFPATLIYEPLRPDPVQGGTKEVSVGPGGTMLSCLLQCVNHWKPNAVADEEKVGTKEVSGGPVQQIGLSAGEGLNWTSQSRTVMLPPGEHWYLVQDDATRAGSVLSVYVDGSHLKAAESSIEFKELNEELVGLSLGGYGIEPTEYPPQTGFSIWAKAEISLGEKLFVDGCSIVSNLQLLSNVSDPALKPFLRVVMMRVVMNTESDQKHKCAEWKVTSLASVPLLPVTTLPLDDSKLEEGWTAKYVVLVEANVPSPMKGGKFQMQIAMPPWEAKLKPLLAPKEEEPDEVPKYIEVASLKANHVMRWSGETVQNDGLVVLKERITVRVGADVTATLRVTVTGLPKAFLRAALVAQLPPDEGMRPKTEDGSSPEPIAFGMPIDPKEYGGRLNWIARCRTVVEESGPGVVVMPHVLLCEGSTYRLDVCLDAYKGLSDLEGGTWLLEVHGSGEVEVGADKMEDDLEGIIYKSFEDAAQDPALPLRKDRAKTSRKEWRRMRGLDPPPTEEELAKEAEAAAAAAAAAADPKAKGKKDDSAARASVSKDELEAAAVAEQLALKEAIDRARAVPHQNKAVEDFLLSHIDDPPVLKARDPWTVAPDAPPPGELPLPWAKPELTTNSVATYALGAAGKEEVRAAETEQDGIKWEQIEMHMENAKEAQEQGIVDLAAWRDEKAAFELQFLAERAELQSGLNVRFQKRSALKSLVQDPEKSDVAALRQALAEAQEAGVSTWDQELLTRATQKAEFFEAIPALQAALDKFAEEPLGEDAAAREEFKKIIVAVKEPLKQLQKAKVPIPVEIPFKDLLNRADLQLKDPAVDEGEGAPA